MTKCTLSQVKAALREEFSTDKWSLKAVRSILESYDHNTREWEKHCQFDDHCYYRVVIDTGNDRYNLVILCWNTGQGTPIHDHPSSECMFKVCNGEITETRYELPESSGAALRTTEEILLEEGQVGHINDNQGLHRMSNDSDTDTCVTLHCYFPPYKMVHMYDERTGTATRFEVKCVLCPDTCPRNGPNPETSTCSRETPTAEE